MMRKFLLGFLFLFTTFCYSQNPVEKFYEAYNTKNWKKFEKLLHKDFKCIPDSNEAVANRIEFYHNMHNTAHMWFAEWKILSMEETSPGCYTVNGTFTDEFDMWLYGAPREGKWIYCTKDNKIISIDWLDFPENPNQAKADEKEKAFMDWIALNDPEYTGISVYWGPDWGVAFKDLFYAYKKHHE